MVDVLFGSFGAGLAISLFLAVLRTAVGKSFQEGR